MSIDSLTPIEFENLTYDLLKSAGMRGLVWRTPGSDGGRDIEGVFSNFDFSGHCEDQKWYIECKRYSSSISWPTVWNKIAHAECAGARYLLLVTNNNPSPTCESRIAEWNTADKRVSVRVWRGYELSKMLNVYRDVATKYGLVESSAAQDLSLQSLLIETMKATQSSYVGKELGLNISRELEYGAALAELVSKRIDEIKNYGRLVKSDLCTAPPIYPWLEWNGPTPSCSEAGLRALVTTYRHLTRAETVTAKASSDDVELRANGQQLSIETSGQDTLELVARWADLELTVKDRSCVALCYRN